MVFIVFLFSSLRFDIVAIIGVDRKYIILI